ncbi:Mpo1 family 2-hydroxy fatty acid dioxygenase [Gallaecimonas mangrovi]|uniref:Mpo1 family 2-hydroxy fatty acid dioxygenase n=1 Tax=Gallaecimonas mangrovi TaxID=2291597 RepID=UPI000E2090E2|nr:Mpo1-like protein [Gallaecimonas mangrovi]
MKSLTEHLSQYAGYHRDRRNIRTHLIGIPLIVIAIATLLARPHWGAISPALIVAVGCCLFYVRLNWRLGLVMTALLLLACALGWQLALLSTPLWLGWGVGLFVVGWLFQFVGHYFEGKKPAFIDDVTGLIIGPLFVVAELGFYLGCLKKLKNDIESEAGPLH